jgi:nucleoside-diphosphate-sugar epimerase
LLSGKTFLVTGATGRLGCDLTPRLESLGARVLPLVLPPYPRVPENDVVWKAATEPIDVRDEEDLSRLTPPDHVVHLHWWVDRTRSFDDQVRGEVRQNVTDLEYLWDWVKRHPVRSFVNCSSIRVFGRLNPNPIDASAEPRPESPYGTAKAIGERYFDTAFAGHGMEVVQLRLCSVCSHGEHPSHLMSRLLRSAFHGGRVKVNTGHSANLIYIDEVVDVVINAALSGSTGRFLITTPETAIDEIARRVEAVTGRELAADYVDLAPGATDPVFVSDIDRFRADWVRVTPLDEAIRRMAEAGYASPDG